MHRIKRITQQLLISIGILATMPLYGVELLNASFEDGWDGWTDGDTSGSGTSISDVANTGSQSVKLTEEANFVSQVVDLVPNTTYQLTGYIRGGGNLGAKVGSDLFFEQQAPDGNKWTEVNVFFDSTVHEAATIFGSFAGVEGRFDDFSLTAIEGDGVQTSIRIIGEYGLSPDLPPGKNFDLLGWYLNTPADEDNSNTSDRFDERTIAAGFEDDQYFYTAEDGGMVFVCTIDGAKTSINTRYTRTELRQMLRRGDTSIRTRLDNGRPNENNWVFSSAPQSAQNAAGAIDGELRATLAVNRVTTTGTDDEVGSIVIGQIHAKDDEPARLYYRKLPGNEKGSLFFAHESSTTGDDTYYNLLGDLSDDVDSPEDGIALDEVFSYEIIASGNDLHINILQEGVLLASKHVDMSDSGYDVANDYMYFKAGVYNQNQHGDPDDYAQATFYELEVTH